MTRLTSPRPIVLGACLVILGCGAQWQTASTSDLRAARGTHIDITTSISARNPHGEWTEDPEHGRVFVRDDVEREGQWELAIDVPAWDHVQVLQSTHIDCPAVVVGVLDVHVPVPGIGSALSRLRRRALALGADAVLGVEFHHGHGDEGEPTHLSGLAVRCMPPSS